MRTLFIFVVAIVMAASCGKKIPPPTVVRVVETVEVKVPVPVARAVPPELLVPLAPPLPSFVAPQDVSASSALTADGERLLRGLLNDLLTRIAAWEAWAKTP